MPEPRYRIVTDNYAGYEVQIWRWWWPFWKQPYINTYHSVAQAEAWITGGCVPRYRKRVVKNL